MLFRFPGEVKLYFLLKILSKLLWIMPPAARRGLGVFFGLVWYYLIPVRRKVAIDNVAFALTGGDKKSAARIVRESFINITTSMVRFLANDPRDLAAVQVEGFDCLKGELGRGCGAILAVGHVGDWDLNECVPQTLGFKIHLLTRRVKSGGLQRFWEETRALRGNVYLSHNAPAVTLLKALKKNEVVALAVDQSMPPMHAVKVNFFGKPAATTFTPALLAARTGARVVPTFGAREPDGRYVFRFFEPIAFEKTGALRDDSIAMMEKVNRVLEGFIREHPGQWLWAHRRWKG
jgi:KDO2-lipid IV(A) lauroyltransferase